MTASFPSPSLYRALWLLPATMVCAATPTLAQSSAPPPAVPNDTKTAPAPAASAAPATDAKPSMPPIKGGSELPFANLDVTPSLLSRLSAESIRFNSNVVQADGNATNPVRLQSGDASIKTRHLTVNLANRSIAAAGDVAIERMVTVMRHDMTPFREPKRFPERVRELLYASEFKYDAKTKQGMASMAHLHMSMLDLSANSLRINDRRLTASHILLRPGGLTDEERKIYGEPPFNLRASHVTIDASNSKRMRTTVRGAGLYYKNTRILPVPSYVFGFGARTGGGSGGDSFTVTPRIGFNSADGFLVTTRIGIPVSSNPDRLSLNADLGFSRNVGFRGGLAATHTDRVGIFELSLRRADIIGTQLTSRIELDRAPHFSYTSPLVPLTHFGNRRRISGAVIADIGKLTERQTDTSIPQVSSTRKHIAAFLTTRTAETYGPYLDLFAGHSTYSDFAQNYDNKGFEIGYEGRLHRKLRGVLAYRHTQIDGVTPFRFDLVEIGRELRATVDYAISRRYIIPFDIRYDLQLHQTRDRSFGLLRSYKTFGYGVTYDTARSNLSFEVRSGF